MDDEDEICGGCNGSGEGRFDGTNCQTCGGSGVINPAKARRKQEEMEDWADRERDRRRDERLEARRG